MKKKKQGEKGNGQCKGKEKREKDKDAFPVFSPLFPFSSLFLPLLVPLPSPDEAEHK